MKNYNEVTDLNSHINIKGNREANEQEKDVLTQPISNIKIPYTCFKNHIQKYTYVKWSGITPQILN